MKKVLILGADGFSGKHQLDFLVSHKINSQYEIVAVDKTVSCTHYGIRWVQSDLSVNNAVESILIQERPDYVINFIGLFSSSEFAQIFEYNVALTQRIFQAIKENSLSMRNILLIGSAAEYGEIKKLPVKEKYIGQPISIYGLAKVYQHQLATYYFKQYHIPFVLARTFNVFGKGMSPSLSIGSFQKQIDESKDGDTIFVGNIDAKRDFLPIEKVVEYYWQLLLNGKPCEVYNVCSGHSITIRSLLEDLIQKSGKKLTIAFEQGRIKKTDIDDIYGDNSKLMSLIAT